MFVCADKSFHAPAWLRGGKPAAIVLDFVLVVWGPDLLDCRLNQVIVFSQALLCPKRLRHEEPFEFR